MPQPTARWNEERDCWESDDLDLISGLPAVWSETWPASGTTRAGAVYPLPAWEPPTGDGECSSLPLLTTPIASDANTATPDNREKQLRAQILNLLPTPRSSDTNRSGSHGDGGPDLRTVACSLPLEPPTAPRADQDSGGPAET